MIDMEWTGKPHMRYATDLYAQMRRACGVGAHLQITPVGPLSAARMQNLFFATTTFGCGRSGQSATIAKSLRIMVKYMALMRFTQPDEPGTKKGCA